jgi:dTDP-4-amino-4,6-dideoxygalactose transaminase
MPDWKVPFVNYKIQYQQIGVEIVEAVKCVMANGDFILRQDVEEFENNIANFIGVKYAVGVNSGTDALRLALRVAGVKRGDKVIVSSHTVLATLDAIADVGAWPVLIDSGRDYNMNTALLLEPIWADVKAIMPVHMNGRMVNMDVITYIADKYGIAIIEDAAQSLGASFKGKKAVSYSLGCLSFFPAKCLGSAGDAGMVVTDDINLAQRLRAMRDYGRVKGEEQVLCYGYNTRLDNLQAAILNVKFKYLSQWIERRRSIARHYNLRLSNFLPAERLPFPPSEGDYFDTFQNYVIRVDAREREDFIKHMIDNDVECLVFGRTPLHKQKAFGLGYYHLPVTESICREVVSLPMYPELTDEQVDYVCDVIRRFYK